MVRVPFEVRVDEATSRFEASRKSLWHIQRASSSYQPDDPAPYGAAAASLASALAAARDAFLASEQQRKDLASSLPTPPPPGRLAGLRSRLPSPTGAWTARRRLSSFVASVEQLEVQVGLAQGALAELEGVPLQVAARCQEARRREDEIREALGALRAGGVSGPTLEVSEAEAERLRLALDALPGHLARPTEAPSRQQATKAETIAAWGAMERIEAPLANLARRCEDWGATLVAISAGLGTLGSTIAAAEKALGSMPPALDAGALRAEMSAAGDQATRLEATRPLEVEGLSPLLRNVSWAVEQARDLETRTAELPGHLEALAAGLAQADKLLERLQKRMGQAAGPGIYPIAWGDHQSAWQKLQEARSGLGDEDRVRTPDELLQDATTVQALSARLRVLAAQVEQVVRQREALILLARRPELSATPAWLAEAKRLHDVAALYAPENWKPGQAVPQLYPDALGLYGRLRQALPLDPGHRLPAAELGGLLAQVRGLAKEIEHFPDRLQRAAREVTALQDTEEQARQELEAARSALVEVLPLLRNAQPRLPSKAAAQVNDLERLDGRAGELGRKLDQRQNGTVEAKAREVARWRGSAQEAMQALLQALSQERTGRRAELQADVDELLLIGRFDWEGAVIDATRLLRQPAAAPDTAGRGRPHDVASLAAGVGQILIERQQLGRLQEKLRSDVKDRLERPRSAWETARREAAAEFVALQKTKEAVEGSWPHLALSIYQAQELVGQAEAHERQLPRNGRSVSTVLDIWGRAASTYAAATAEIRRKRAQVDRERGELAELAGRIERWRRQLEAYQKAHAGDDAAAQAVGSRLAEVTAAVDALSHAWARRPPSFREARGRLEGLWRSAHADVPLGDGRTVRIREIEATSR